MDIAEGVTLVLKVLKLEMYRIYAHIGCLTYL